MKSRSGGWTTLELLVSMAVLGLLLVFAADILGVSQRAWLSIRSASRRQDSLDAALDVLKRELSRATLHTRLEHQPGGVETVRESDLHFVCGPASELLPGRAAAIGDAVFFQAAAAEGALREALQARGFWIEYGTDEAWRPPFLLAQPRKRFRLLLWHPPATAFTLHQSPLALITDRAALYAWFQQLSTHVSVVAENIIAMRIQAVPGTARTYDSRRHQWSPGAPEAAQTRHQLPAALHIQMLVVDEASWARLPDSQSEKLAQTVITKLRLPPEGQDDALLDDLQSLIQSQGAVCELRHVLLPLAQSR
jgi:uncharacterized protein (TIGR02599 family)